MESETLIVGRPGGANAEGRYDSIWSQSVARGALADAGVQGADVRPLHDLLVIRRRPVLRREMCRMGVESLRKERLVGEDSTVD
jgi:hypothetical protein